MSRPKAIAISAPADPLVRLLVGSNVLILAVVLTVLGMIH